MRLTLLALALATLLVASSAYPAERERAHYPQPGMADGQTEWAHYAGQHFPCHFQIHR